jgi:hypothetical protein
MLIDFTSPNCVAEPPTQPLPHRKEDNVVIHAVAGFPSSKKKCQDAERFPATSKQTKRISDVRGAFTSLAIVIAANVLIERQVHLKAPIPLFVPAKRQPSFTQQNSKHPPTSDSHEAKGPRFPPQELAQVHMTEFVEARGSLGVGASEIFEPDVDH